MAIRQKPPIDRKNATDVQPVEVEVDVSGNGSPLDSANGNPFEGEVGQTAPQTEPLRLRPCVRVTYQYVSKSNKTGIKTVMITDLFALDTVDQVLQYEQAVAAQNPEFVSCEFLWWASLRG